MAGFDLLVVNLGCWLNGGSSVPGKSAGIAMCHVPGHIVLQGLESDLWGARHM